MLPCQKPVRLGLLMTDDTTAVGSLSSLLQWWEHLSCDVPDFGYFPNASKTVLIVKPEHLTAAKSIFAGTNIKSHQL